MKRYDSNHHGVVVDVILFEELTINDDLINEYLPVFNLEFDQFFVVNPIIILEFGPLFPRPIIQTSLQIIELLAFQLVLFGDVGKDVLHTNEIDGLLFLFVYEDL
jgi:hypothetical protein